MRRTEEEIHELVNEMADYIIENNSSVRQTAKYFDVSVFTVSTYMNNKLSKWDSRYQTIQEILSGHRLTIDKEETQKRILKEVELLLAGYDCIKISEIVGISSSQISLDLSERLPKISGVTKETLLEVRKRLKENSINNLVQNSIESEENAKKGKH